MLKFSAINEGGCQKEFYSYLSYSQVKMKTKLVILSLAIFTVVSSQVIRDLPSESEKIH